MKKSSIGLTALSALALFVGLSGCQTITKTFTRPFGKGEAGLVRVDALVDRVERVYVESELAKENVHAMLDALHAITAEDFSGDPHAAHAACVAATEAAADQAGSFRESVDEMEETAEPFFERWEEDLDTFASAEMRERSRARLEETRAHYADIRAAATPARTGYESFQRRVHDLTVFLENDFNAASISAVEGDVRALTDHAAQIVARLDACLDAAESYVRGASLPTRADATPAEDEDEDGAPVEATPTDPSSSEG